MKKLIFKYGAMNGGKSMHLIMTYYNYKELGLNPVAVVPNFLGKKTRYIHSRNGCSVVAINFSELGEHLKNNKVDVVLVDESQFLNEEQVRSLANLTLNGVAVICYGLRTTSSECVFQGAKYLLALADELEEIPTLCRCGRKARRNIRYIDGKLDLSYEEIKLRGEENITYESVCKKCYHEIVGINKKLKGIE